MVCSSDVQSDSNKTFFERKLIYLPRSDVEIRKFFREVIKDLYQSHRHQALAMFDGTTIIVKAIDTPEATFERWAYVRNQQS